MTVVTLHAAGKLDPDTAWLRYLEPERWPGWAPQIVDVRASAPRIAAGVTGRVYGPLKVSADFVVERVDEAARSWTWRVHRGPLTVRLHHAVQPRDGGGSTTSLGIDGPLPVALGYAPLARLALGRLVHP